MHFPPSTALAVFVALGIAPTPVAPAGAPPLASCTNLPAPPASAAVANDNRTRAGTLRDGVLTLRVVMRSVAWRPDGPSGCGLGVHAFAEEGKPATVPGPLIRVNGGTEVRVTVRNALPATMWVRGLQDRTAGGKLDSAEVMPGASREFRFVPATPGSWFYWAGSTAEGVPSSNADGQLVGAMVVDSASTGRAPREDRILVLTRWNPSGAADNKGFQLNAFNGRSWPNTERLTYTANDSVRWHVINASNTTHEMHLHGFFFRIDDRGFAIDSVVSPPPAASRMRVTSVMRPGEWLQIAWLPDRPGNWLYHCHLLTHMSGAQRLDRMAETSAAAEKRDHGTDASGNHAAHDMGGLVMALDVRPARTGTASAAPATPARALDLYANSRPGRFGERPGYAFILQDGPVAPAADSIRIPGSPLILTKGEPVRIAVHNRLTIPISVHWHGLELDSYFDGVGGFSGEGRRIAPMIAATDSFIVRLTPPRAGTFMYHIHGERGDELASGLYGVLVVADPATPFDPGKEPLFSFADGGPGEDTPIFINGSASPDTLNLVAGTPYRFRLIYIMANDVLMTTLRGPNGVVSARFAGLDGFDTPNGPPRPVQVPTGPGHTRDFSVTFDASGDYALVAQRTTGGKPTAMPIRVK
jgi:FtsP/CotA-like multicopper oxidase with cupredoxin domain